jgi:hypothetical protein
MSGVIIHSYVDTIQCDKHTNIEIFANSRQYLLDKKANVTRSFEWGEPGYDNVQINWDNTIWENETNI